MTIIKTDLWKLNRRLKNTSSRLGLDFWSVKISILCSNPNNLHLCHTYFSILNLNWIFTNSSTDANSKNKPPKWLIMIVFINRSCYNRGTVERFSLWIWSKVKSNFLAWKNGSQKGRWMPGRVGTLLLKTTNKGLVQLPSFEYCMIHSVQKPQR